jgi:DNA-binding beta-propeller fold protein YncE
VAQLPLNTSGCPRRVGGIQDIAVDGDGRLYVPHCNGSLLVYSAHYELLQVVGFGKNVQPVAVSPTAGAATVFIVDLNDPAALSEYDLKTGQRIRTLQAGADAALRDVEVDVVNGSVWATDATASRVYHWAADGSLLSLFNRSSPSAALFRSPFYLAVDRTHGQLLLSEQTTNVSSLAVTASLLWLDAETGAELDRFTFPAVADDFAMGVAVTEDGASVYVAATPNPRDFGIYRPVYVFNDAKETVTASD